MYEIEEMIIRNAKPMSVEKFVLLAHSRGWKQYCECVIDKDGLVYDLRGGHAQMLAALAAKEMGVTAKEYYDTVPKEYWLDMGYYARKISGALSVRFESTIGAYAPNKKQKETINKLVETGLILDRVESETIEFERE